MELRGLRGSDTRRGGARRPLPHILIARAPLKVQDQPSASHISRPTARSRPAPDAAHSGRAKMRSAIDRYAAAERSLVQSRDDGEGGVGRVQALS